MDETFPILKVVAGREVERLAAERYVRWARGAASGRMHPYTARYAVFHSPNAREDCRRFRILVTSDQRGPSFGDAVSLFKLGGQMAKVATVLHGLHQRDPHA